jgi:hypothetical protein
MEAKELFDICRRLTGEGPSPTATRRMHELLVLTCAEGCRRQGGTFGNLFSQVDFLCQRHGLKGEERRAMQTMRRHSNGTEAIDATDWPYDLRSLSLLIAAVFGESVPGALRCLLPSLPRQREKGLSINRRHLRCLVRSWDGQTIEATTDDGDIAIDYARTDQGRDFAYLRKMLREGMQLNLLDNHVETGGRTVVPGLIIVEPDFLVDISSIAACFTNYGHHPLLYTVNRLRPKPNTQAVLLGNFAGTALDETVKGPGRDVEGESLRRSFREQALRFCACQDFDAARFKSDAALQVSNIREAADVLFPSPSSRAKALLEPSFVCERLGLQGRVDLMTTDLRLLVEQKSGRNPKIEHQSHDAHGMQLESHYVQLLLYYGILRHHFGLSADSVDIRLLYSRYPASQGLMAVNFYQHLFAEALRLRNQIVATELLIAREGFGRIVPLLCPAVIYKEATKDRVYHQYVEPELNRLSALLAALTPTERAYYERMMTFVYREQVCQKLGCADARLHHGGGAASDLWLMPLSEKRETGNIVCDLSLARLERSSADGGFDLMRLALDQPLSGQENFRRGDMVYLYAYDGCPDVQAAILYKGTLERMDTDGLTVRLTNAQQRADLLTAEDRRWAMEHASADVGTSSAIRSLQQFAEAPADRRALLLGQREPRADASVRLSRSYHPHYDDIVLRAFQSLDYFLLIGPPGTGKTSMALKFLVQEWFNSGWNDLSATGVLLMSYTNRAVDEICAMLTEASLPYLRIGNEASCDPRFRDHLLEERLGQLHRLDDVRRCLRDTPVIVGTTSTLQSRQEVLQLKHFTLCIIDEASQILEPSVIGLIASQRIDRFILIGDHKQLPAVVQQGEHDAAVSEPLLRRLCIDDCRQSLFQRLLRWEQSQGRTRFVGVLRHQGRMHPEVARFPSLAFYAGEQLQPVPLPHQQADTLGYDLPSEDPTDDLLKSHRVLFFDSGDGGHDTDDPAASDKVNAAEARIVADLLRRIHRFYGDRFSPTKTVGVIVPYRNQIAMIRQAVSRLSIPALLDVSIDTVERYQGSQRDVIIYSFTVSRGYQLDFLTANTFFEHGLPIDRKLNVALTRARCQMLMTGNARLLRRNELFARLVVSPLQMPVPRQRQ